jgi:cephalosporin hydroxylase
MSNQTLDPVAAFFEERRQAIATMAQDEELKRKSLDWMLHADQYKYTYNFTWMGRPIIKYPSDILLMQEIIWDIKPDLIIETGIAHGGSIVFSASMLELLGGDREVVAVDIDIRKHNREQIEAHPMSKRIHMIEGSSTDPAVLKQIMKRAEGKKCVLVALDSLHTHDHVLDEMRLYAPLVTMGSYLVLPDTFIEYFPKGYYNDRPWDVGNNPMTALKAFMQENDDFVIDTERCNKLLITEGFDGYLKRVK